MQTIIAIILAISLIGSIQRFNEWRKERKEAKERVESESENCQAMNEEEAPNSETEHKTPNTCALMYNTLCNLGCQPKLNDDGILTVQYQGENFNMEFGGRYVRVWDPMWSGVKADDPELSKIREAVNLANFNFGPTVVMTAPDEQGVIGLHSRRDIMLHPACPDNEPFVKAVLDSFFDAKEQVRSNYQQINVKQTEATKSRRPVGFTTGSQE